MDKSNQITVEIVYALAERFGHYGRTATGSPAGPFQVYDTVGFNVAANIARASGDPTRIKFADLLQKGIDAGKAGLGDGEGFYTYDSDGNVQEPVTSWNHP